MLRRLVIEEYGLIPKAEIEFSGGATMFTGETGSGKTMVLGALAFALGERAGADTVRRAQARAVVTLEFEPGDSLRQRLSADGFEIDADETGTISRELNAAGKSGLRLNGRPATAGYVRDIASEFVDIVGQHEAQRLLAPNYHLELLDRFADAGAQAARERVAALHAQATEIANRLHEFAKDERRAQERHAYAKYALEEIEAAAPEPGEDERLGERRRFLDNVERIAIALRDAREALAGERASGADALGAAAVALNSIRGIGPALAEMAASAAAMQSEVNELAARIARELDATQFEPAELEAINERLNVLDNLKRKYGGSLDAVLSAAEEFRATVGSFADAGELTASLQKKLAAAQDELKEAAAQLSALRASAAQRLRKAIESELKELALPAGRFGVTFEALPEIGPRGAERAEFLFAANTGDAERPLARIASGGELSRVLLALVVALAENRPRTALVFDEIDADIGGTTATAVGIRLGRLARDAQIICVTHLAQIASWADQHYVLEKSESRSGAVISVQRIAAAPERAGELARMLSGETHDAALEHARILLRQTDERRAALAAAS